MMKPLGECVSPGYRHAIRAGDLVRLPDGRRGTVRMVETGVGGCGKVASVDVSGARRRWFGLAPPIPERFADLDINRLELLATKDEYERLGNEGHDA